MTDIEITNKRNFPWHLAALVIVPLLAYASSLSNGFVWDDIVVVVENPLLKSLKSIPQLLLSQDTFPGVLTGYYRPFTYLTFLFDATVWGLNPFGFHLTNVLLHTGVVISVYFLASSLGFAKRAAFFSAFLFALHPVNAEAVNLISARNTLLVGLLIVTSIVCYIRGHRNWSVLLFMLATFSKELGLLVPLVIIFHDVTIKGKKLSLGKYWPFIAGGGLYLVLRKMVVGTGSGRNFDAEHLADRLLLVPEIILRYLKNLLIPMDLRIPYIIKHDGLDPILGITWIGLLLISAMIIYYWRERFVLFSAFWFFLFILPVVNIFPLKILMADRYAYVPAIGVCLLCGYLFGRLKERLSYAFIGAAFVIYLPLVLMLNASWKDEPTFYHRMVKDAPDSDLGYHNLGLYYQDRGDFNNAKLFLQKAVGTGPETSESYISLALLHIQLEDYPSALQVLTRASETMPDDVETHVLLSRVFSVIGNEAAALSYMNRVRATFPDVDDWFKWISVEIANEAEGRRKANQLFKAERIFRKSLYYDPNSSLALIGLGNVAGQRGNIDKAIDYFLRAAKVNPVDPVPHYNLSQAYAIKGMTHEAQRELDIYNNLAKNAPSVKR